MKASALDALALVPAYLYWHYAKGAKHIWRVSGNISWFLWHFFSVELLSKTLFSPWWREGEDAHVSWFAGLAEWRDFFSAVAVNLIVTLFGVVVRGIVICIGLVAQAVVWILTCAFFLIWLVLPGALLYFLLAGIVFVGRPM